MVKEKMMVPSVLMSEVSDYNQSVRIVAILHQEHKTYQVDDASWVGLLGGLLGEEQEALAGVGSPSGILVGNFGLFPAEIACKVLRLDSVRSEVEELLLEDETPKWQALSATISSTVDKCIDAAMREIVPNPRTTQ
jgi:hypothetical protein